VFVFTQVCTQYLNLQDAVAVRDRNYRMLVRFVFFQSRRLQIPREAFRAAVFVKGLPIKDREIAPFRCHHQVDLLRIPGCIDREASGVIDLAQISRC